MFSIGELSKLTKVKVPTIRYYEEMGLCPKLSVHQATNGDTTKLG